MLVFMCGQLGHVVVRSGQKLANLLLNDEEKTQLPQCNKRKAVFPAVTYDGIHNPRIPN